MNTPPRTLEQLRHQFEVERELAQRLLHSNRAERTQLFRILYAELFSRVPDHPRLTRRDTAESSRRAVQSQFALLKESVAGVDTFLEFAPGDCRLAFEVCRHVKQVIGVDISDQSGGAQPPANFRLVVYDGYQLDLPADSVDLAFSYQFIEHLHPDDVELHFRMIHRVLRPGGRYIFSTPHRLSGPHDVSRFFSDTPSGFHLKEWSYRELGTVVKQAGFADWHTFRFGRPRLSGAVNALTLAAETTLGALPRALRRPLSMRIFPDVTMIVRK